MQWRQHRSLQNTHNNEPVLIAALAVSQYGEEVSLLYLLQLLRVAGRQLLLAAEVVLALPHPAGRPQPSQLA
jgi:hypothetical protein